MDEVRVVAEQSEGMHYSPHISFSSLTTKGNANAQSIRPCDVFTYMFGSSSGG